MLKRLKSQILEVALQKIIMNDEIYLEQRKVVTLSLTLQARLWACGRGDVSTPNFGSHLNPISTRGANYAHPIYWCPHQVLKATGAPSLCSDLFRRGKLNHNADADGGVRQFILSTDNLK